MHITRDGPLPIARQIADQLIALIRSGELRSGDRLPAVRVLAGFLRVNRNTVAKVYLTLERDGWLATTQGRGTFVTARPPTRSAADLTDLAPLLDRLLAEAAARGISREGVGALIASRGPARSNGELPRVGFVECNPSDLAYFSRQLSGRLSHPLIPVLLSELRRRGHELDLIATTLFHVEEIRRMMPRHEVIGLMAAPDFTTLDEVAHLPSASRIALICATQEGVQSKERSIRAVGMKRARLTTATLQHTERLRNVLSAADVVLASPKVLERIAADVPARARVIPFASVLGDGAVTLLAQRIGAWRRDRAQPRAKTKRSSR